MKATVWMVVLVVALAGAVDALAGTLVAGKPEVEGSRVTVPILLQGEQEGVSAMDFRVNYDPSVLTPAGVIAGSAASAANKQVQSNVVNDDEMVVIVMGMNQTAVQPGEVARATFDLKDTSAAKPLNLNITKTTFASSLGEEIASSGSSNTIDLANLDSSVNEESGEDDPEQDSSGDNPSGDGQNADTTGPANDDKDNAGEETGPGAVPAGPVAVEGRGETDSGTEGMTAGTVGEMATTPDAETTPSTADATRKLDTLAAAANEVRGSIPTPPGQPDAASESATPGAAIPGADMASAQVPGTQQTPGLQPAGAPGAAATAPGAGAPDMTAAKAASAEPAASGPQASGTAKPEPGAAAASPKVSTKVIVLAVVIAVLVAAFLVRRRLFS